MGKSNKIHNLSVDEIKKLQNIELELLIEFDRICRKHNITYSIDGGTLLGAVRHGGFIPWDDDADVILNRKEYEKFLLVVDQELNKDKFYFQDLNRTTGYRWGYGKLRRANTEFVRLNQEYMPYEQGIFLDVFVCDNVPDNYLLRCICNFNSFIFRKIFYSKVGKHTAVGIDKLIYRILELIPEKSIKKIYAKYVKFRNRKSTEMVKCLTFPACNRVYGYKRKWYEDTIDMKFQGITLKACRDYDEYLRFLYGDYLKLPPVEKRKVHPVSKLRFPED
ncbi:LicD family protein [Clostridium thermarum]|uniref:LicD family protein n=1 Tax=Clostridium thermarum TaxID=1716543 RepID=UPI0013D54D36|nr:LicD family protein [Clostridium thermarum]